MSVFAILFRANFDNGKILVIFNTLSTKINTIKIFKNSPAFASNSCKSKKNVILISRLKLTFMNLIYAIS